MFPLLLELYSKHNIDIWNRIWITYYHDSTNEMLRKRYIFHFSSLYLWIFIYYIYPYNYRMHCSFRSNINLKQLTQWILLAYGVFHSTSFIIVNYWKEMGKYIEKKRYILLGIIIVFQVGLFLLLKLYFFEQFNENANIPVPTDTTSNTNDTNTTTPSNSTLLI